MRRLGQIEGVPSHAGRRRKAWKRALGAPSYWSYLSYRVAWYVLVRHVRRTCHAGAGGAHPLPGRGAAPPPPPPTPPIPPSPFLSPLFPLVSFVPPWALYDESPGSPACGSTPLICPQSAQSAVPLRRVALCLPSFPRTPLAPRLGVGEICYNGGDERCVA